MALRNLQASSNGTPKKAEKMKPASHADYHAGMVSFLSVPCHAKGCYKYLLKEWIKYWYWKKKKNKFGNKNGVETNNAYK